MQHESKQHSTRPRTGTIFYVDGAGGGRVNRGWARRVHRGITEGGFRGWFITYRWHTGRGTIADQVSSVEYKRRHGRDLAERIAATRAANPNEPIHVVAYSAGTAIAVFALEALPVGVKVDDVVLIASSLSSAYDARKALRRVRGRLSVYVSPFDAVLSIFVPILGTADRRFCGRRILGLRGFDADFGNAVKVRVIPWCWRFSLNRHFGGHTGAVNWRFIRAHVARLLL